MMKEWLRGRGRQPANWATLVAVLRNAGFSELAGQVEQLVPTLTDGGRGGDRIELTIPCTLTDHQLHSLSQACVSVQSSPSSTEIQPHRRQQKRSGREDIDSGEVKRKRICD